MRMKIWHLALWNNFTEQLGSTNPNPLYDFSSYTALNVSNLGHQTFSNEYVTGRFCVLLSEKADRET